MRKYNTARHIPELTTLHKRMLLFVVGCLGARLLLAYIAKTVSKDWLRILGYLALIPAAGFLYIYLTGSRKTGAEVFGDRIWWNSLRPIHAVLYLLFAILAIAQYTCAWKVLLADVILGAIAFGVHHGTGLIN